MAKALKPSKTKVTTTTTTTTTTTKKSSEKKSEKVSLKDFEMLKMIGKGSYGEVRVVRQKATGIIYAMKVMKKRRGLQKRHIARILAERDVMAFSGNPWIVELHYSFQDSANLYLVMEFMQGGDLMGILIRHDLLSEEQTQFYIAEIALAIESVHKLDYCHRDLKPDNVLLDSEGHIKLSDFGLAKGLGGSFSVKTKSDPPEKKMTHQQKKKAWRKNNRQIFSMVGTPDYMAPEICKRLGGYKQNCDWWSLGVMMYECLCGYPPFYAGDSGTTIDKVKNWQDEFGFPDDPGGLTNVKISNTAKDLIKKLITSADKRMTFDQLKAHKFFEGVDWDNIRKNPAIIKPPIKGELDLSNFDEFNSQESRDHAPPVEDTMETIIGYTFQRVAKIDEVKDEDGLFEEGDDGSESDD